MEPRLNIRISQIFEAAPGDVGNAVDVDFQSPDEQWVGDFIDQDSNHAQQNFQAYEEQRAGIGEHLDRNVQNTGFSSTPNPAADPMLMVMNPQLVGSPDLAEANVNPQLGIAASKLRKQANGFSNAPVRPDFTLGVVANLRSSTLTGSRVVVETPNTKIAGTVLAVGDGEFAVLWDDRTASVERKGDYELVFAE